MATSASQERLIHTDADALCFSTNAFGHSTEATVNHQGRRRKKVNEVIIPLGFLFQRYPERPLTKSKEILLLHNSNVQMTRKSVAKVISDNSDVLCILTDVLRQLTTLLPSTMVVGERILTEC